KVARNGEVGLCGTCMDARGLRDDELIDGAKRGTLAQLADWTAGADKVLVF
ncbi:DsrE family protein, partial [Myxococcota bacterium]|nr:DsrE family protein [Myxococcota bacterium]